MTARDADRVTETVRIALAHEVHGGEVGDPPHGAELFVLAGRVERVLELDAAIEVVFDRVLAPPGDDEDVVDPCTHRLLYDVLDRGRVDDRQHLLRHRLGRGEEAGAEPGGGDHGVVDRPGHGHRT